MLLYQNNNSPNVQITQYLVIFFLFQLSNGSLLTVERQRYCFSINIVCSFKSITIGLFYNALQTMKNIYDYDLIMGFSCLTIVKALWKGSHRKLFKTTVLLKPADKK